MPQKRIVILVHGWSVHSTDTYGHLADRLEHAAAQAGGPALDVRNIWLSRYVSFKDEVRLDDLARGFEAALKDNIYDLLRGNRRFACITHSTGGPVVRLWWDRYYSKRGFVCPMSHLIMLAPANFGSALAQLGKGRVSRLKSWFSGVEPGQGVLDWLELGSSGAWDLNRRWISEYPDPVVTTHPVFPFVLTGQTIDRKLYDHVNSYTGELGSDGVVRVASANMNSGYVRLYQTDLPAPDNGSTLLQVDPRQSRTKRSLILSLIPGHAHSGKAKGILRSIRAGSSSHPTVAAILKCLKVQTRSEYRKLHGEFEAENRVVRLQERVEPRGFFGGHYFHDSNSMLILRLRDDSGRPVTDFDLVFTGFGDDPNVLPPGFFVDRQRNSHDHGTITYFVNYDVLTGAGPVSDPNHADRELRGPLPGVGAFGLRINPRPDEGFVHYQPAILPAQGNHVGLFFKPDQTTLVDITLRRIVRQGVFQLTTERRHRSFKKQKPGSVIDGP